MVKRLDLFTAGLVMTHIGAAFIIYGWWRASQLAAESCIVTQEDWNFWLSHSIPAWAVSLTFLGILLMLYGIKRERGARG